MEVATILTMIAALLGSKTHAVGFVAAGVMKQTHVSVFVIDTLHVHDVLERGMIGQKTLLIAHALCRAVTIEQ